MNNWDQFVNVITSGEYFYVFVALLLIVILTIIIYIVKLQVDKRRDKEVIEDNDEDLSKEIDEVLKESITHDEIHKSEIFNAEVNQFELNASDVSLVDNGVTLNVENPEKEEIKSNIQEIKKENNINITNLNNLKEIKEESKETIDVNEKLNNTKQTENIIETKSNINDIKENFVINEELKEEPEQIKIEIKNEEAVIKNEINKDTEKSKEELRLSASNKIDEVLEKSRKNINSELFNIDDEPETPKYSNLEQYEQEQEASAIISYEELENRKKDVTMEEISDHIINNYEEEQEQKAIISYEELLQRASNSKLAYKDENVEGLRITRVEPVKEKEEQFKKPYYYEEEFLKSLKEFRKAL